jgi:hypothetical protein
MLDYTDSSPGETVNVPEVVVSGHFVSKEKRHDGNKFYVERAILRITSLPAFHRVAGGRRRAVIFFGKGTFGVKLLFSKWSISVFTVFRP